LNHKVLDNTVERRTLISKTLLSSSQSSKVLGSLWCSLAIETDDDSPHGLIPVIDVEVDLVCNLWTFDGFGGLGQVDKDYGEDE